MVKLGRDMAERAVKALSGRQMALDDRHGHVACGLIVFACERCRRKDFDSRGRSGDNIVRAIIEMGIPSINGSSCRVTAWKSMMPPGCATQVTPE